MRAGKLISLVVALLVVATAYLLASDNAADWHLTAAPGGALCSRSAFVHGYMHGYEQGFHAADLDLQFGRTPSDPATLKEFRHPIGYRGSFGDKRFFTSGYREGFRVGYADGIGGRRFRAVNQLRDAALGLDRDGTSQPSKVFDEGLSAGYEAGRHHGLRDGRAGLAFQEVAVHCHGALFHRLRPGSDEYCEGYGRGYRLGYADGYMNQAATSLAQAEK